jgi:hypothetical protein
MYYYRQLKKITPIKEQLPNIYNNAVTTENTTNLHHIGTVLLNQQSVTIKEMIKFTSQICGITRTEVQVHFKSTTNTILCTGNSNVF